MDADQAQINEILLDLIRKNDEAHHLIIEHIRGLNRAIGMLSEAVNDLQGRVPQPETIARTEEYASEDVRIYRGTRGELVSIHLANRRLDPGHVVRKEEQGLPRPEGTLTLVMDEGQDAGRYRIVVRGPRAKDVADALDEAGRVTS